MNHIKVLARSEEITKVLEYNRLSSEQIERLMLTREVLIFAESIGVESFGNYQRYSQLDGEYITYLITVSKKWDLELVTWWYPIVGRLPYRGYPTLEAAMVAANKFSQDEFDTSIRGVSAYSTLGWFNDPVLSSMLKYSEEDYVELILHELIHANVFFNNEGDFNEQIATYLGAWGTELFYRSKGFEDSSASIQKVKTTLNAKIEFARFLKQEKGHLKKWYKSIYPMKKSEEDRQMSLNSLQVRCRERLVKFHSKIKVCDDLNNNAKILSYGVYYEGIEKIDEFRIKSQFGFQSLLNYFKENESNVEKIKSEIF